MRRLLRFALALAAALPLAAALGAGLFYALVLRALPEIESLADYRPNIITKVYASDGSEIGSIAEERRIVVPIEDVPLHVKQAFIAAEDAAFYEHEGLDYAGIMRALLKNLHAGSVRQGGSTITQQVAKTFLLSAERSYVRKLQDMVLARRIEKHFDKEEILFLYLNQIYLGSGAYGIESAANIYFGKSAGELTLAEGALIAGIVPRPSRWTPHKNLPLAQQRKREVLRRMRINRFISDDQRLEALEQPLEFKAESGSERRSAAAYFVEEVRRYLVGRYGERRVKTDGLQVYTTLHPRRQLAAYRAVRRGLRDHDRRQGYRGPIRRVAEDDWAATLEEIGGQDADRSAAELQLRQALVTEVDDGRQRIRLALGPEREAILTLGQVAWAREPNPEVDGLYSRLDKVSRALQPGDLVWLEATPHGNPSDPDPETGPEYDYALYQEPEAESALISIDLAEGTLDALIGGYSFGRSQFNRALQSRRQPGSAFKPLIYAAALGQGYTPASIIYDTPITYVDEISGFQWKPENYSQTFYGPITLRRALASSRNIATVKLLRSVGIEPVLDTARRLGIDSPLEQNLGLALGNSSVTLTELVRAYTAFASGGRLIDPVFITELRDRHGELLEESVTLIEGQLESAEPDTGEDPEPADDEPGARTEQRPEASAGESGDETDGEPRIPEGYALDPATAFLMSDMLEAVVKEGTGRRLRALRRPVAGKTGTTNDLVDAWFIGFTPTLAAGAWVGFDEPRNLGRSETGSRAASPIILEYLRRSLDGEPVRSFDPPPGVAFVRIDKASGLLPCGFETRFQPFREGTAPQEACTSSGQRGPEDSRPSRPLRLD